MELHDMQHLAKLSRLALSDEEMVRMQSDITSILGYIDQIGKADVSDMTATHDAVNQVREDVVTAKDPSIRDRIMDQAPHAQDDFIQVQQIISR